MVYKVYKKTATVKFPVLFKCENCGNYNAILHPFSVSTTYNDKGVLTQKGIDKREKRTDEDLTRQLSNLYAEIADATMNDNFKKAEYHCICNHCKAKPIWSFFKNTVLEHICKIALYISVFITMFLLLPILDGDYSQTSKLLIPLSILMLTYIPRFILYQVKQAKILATTKEYKPMIFKDQSDCVIKLKQLQNPPKTEYTQTTQNLHRWRCSNCYNLRSQTPCEHCGNE
ncbi:MAG: hypothetical protein IKA17_10285 [Clostridia bacterium]|nr:hypothetical protein [Clostridia bacterium]